MGTSPDSPCHAWFWTEQYDSELRPAGLIHGSDTVTLPLTPRLVPEQAADPASTSGATRGHSPGSTEPGSHSVEVDGLARSAKN
ncbi:MAG: hypothetical protein JWP46_914 [Modestobacter sp.]|nr:hypothetical protein [Modestobacter sp.]